MRRILRIAVRVALAAVVGGTCVAALGVWRLRQGPVSLDALAPRVAAALGGGDPASAVHLDGLELVWDAVDRRVELRARGLRVGGDPASSPAALDALRLRLRARELLRGRVRVRGVEVDGLRLLLVRGDDGRLALRTRTEAGDARDPGAAWAVLGHLETVAVREGRVDLVDERSGMRLVFPRVEGTLRRTGDEVRAAADLAIVSGGAVVPVAVGALYSAATGRLEAHASSAGAETAAAFGVWPAGLAPRVRAWVTDRIRDGRIPSARVEVAGRVVQEDGWKLATETLAASVGFDGLAVRFLDSMPPVTAARGEARFGADGVVVAVESGAVDGVSVAPATVRVSWPRDSAARIAVDARADGPLAKAVAALDDEPVAIGRRLGLQARGIEGRVSGRVRLDFPLDAPQAGRLGLRAAARIAGAHVPYAAAGWEVGKGELAVAISDRSVAVDGTAEVRGAPVGIRYRERLADPAARRLAIVARLERVHRQGLGIDPGDWLDGPVDAAVRIAPDAEGRTRADVDVDLGPAAIEAPLLGLAKAPGMPGRAVLRLRVARGVVTEVERATIDAADVAVRGTAKRPATGGAWSRVAGSITFVPADPIEEPARADVELGAEEGGWRATVVSRDAGRLLRRYGSDAIRGGRATFEGMVDLASGGVPFDGRLTVEQVTVVRAPWLVRVVSLASARGLRDLGGPQTVLFDRVVAGIGHRPPVVVLTDGVARGPKLSLTLAGTVDRQADALDLQGTLVPSYFLLNEGAARIPVLGAVLGGATGGAVQAVDFVVRGARAEPAVTVRPLSSLAPGVLREWLRKLGR